MNFVQFCFTVATNVACFFFTSKTHFCVIYGTLSLGSAAAFVYFATVEISRLAVCCLNYDHPRNCFLTGKNDKTCFLFLFSYLASSHLSCFQR